MNEEKIVITNEDGVEEELFVLMSKPSLNHFPHL